MYSTTWSRCARPITAEPTQLEGDAARQRRDAAACARRRDRSALPGRSRARPLLRPAGLGRNPDPLVEAVVRLAQRVNVRSTPSSGRRLNLYGLGLNAQAAVESVSDRTGGDAHAASVARNLRLRICSRAPPHLGLFLCTDGEEPGRHPHNADKHHAVPAVTVRIHRCAPAVATDEPRRIAENNNRALSGTMRPNHFFWWRPATTHPWCVSLSIPPERIPSPRLARQRPSSADFPWLRRSLSRRVSRTDLRDPRYASPRSRV